MREIGGQGQGVPVVVADPFRSAQRSGWRVVRELYDGDRDPASGVRTIVFAGGH
jgi:hypothetical protein